MSVRRNDEKRNRNESEYRVFFEGPVNEIFVSSELLNMRGYLLEKTQTICFPVVIYQIYPLLDQFDFSSGFTFLARQTSFIGQGLA